MTQSAILLSCSGKGYGFDNECICQQGSKLSDCSG